LLAFAGGYTQRDPRRAALVGLGCTAAALVGYFLMTDSPAEGAHYTLTNARGFFVSEHLVLLGAVVTGPLFGWFGQQWRTRRAIAGALVTAAALCLEPLVRKGLGRSDPLSLGLGGRVRRRARARRGRARPPKRLAFPASRE
jgi:hypothetical protein